MKTMPADGATGVRSSLRRHAPVGGHERSRVVVTVSPLATVGLLTFDAIQSRAHLGTPPTLRSAIRASLDEHDRSVLGVLVRDRAPACLVGESLAPPAS